MISLNSSLFNQPIKLPIQAKVTIMTVGVGILLLGIFSRLLGKRHKSRKSMDWQGRQKYVPKGKHAGSVRRANGELLSRRYSFASRDGRSHQRQSSISYDRMSVSTTLTNLTMQHDVPTMNNEALTPQQLGVMGMEALDTAVGYWEDALAAYIPEGLNQFALTDPAENKFSHHLEDILESAYELQKTCGQLFLYETSVLFRGDQPSPPVPPLRMDGFSDSDRRTMASFSSADSFVSAQAEIGDIRDFDEYGDHEVNIERLALYQSAMKVLQDRGIPCRSFRLDFYKCHSEEEFLVKAHCIRLAFQFLFENQDTSAYFVNAGGQLVTDLLLYAEKDPRECQAAYDEMMDFMQDKSHLVQVEEELLIRGVKCLTFFDVVLDFILLDAFEDLDSPPSSVKAVMQNRWLSNGFKETALYTAVWSVLQAKRRRLKFSDGFFTRFYSIAEHVTPVLAWGFLGPNEELREVCSYFKSEVQGFMEDIFNIHTVHYTTVEDLAKDIFSIAKERFENIFRRLAP